MISYVTAVLYVLGAIAISAGCCGVVFVVIMIIAKVNDEHPVLGCAFVGTVLVLLLAALVMEIVNKAVPVG